MAENTQPLEKVAPSRSPFLSRQFLSIFVIAFLIYCSSQMLSLTLPKYANELGASSQAVGLLAGIFAMCALCMRPISGQVVDNESKKAMLRIVLLVILVSVFGLTMAKDYWLLVMFRGLNGLAWGIGSTLCMTIATNCFSQENMATGIGIYGLGQTIAQTLAPTFALPFAQKFGYNTLYWGNVALILTCLGLTFFMQVEEPRKEKRHYSFNLRTMVHMPALLPASLTMCNNIAKSSITAFLVIFAGGMNIENIGLYFTIQAVTIFVCRPFLSKMADRFGLLKMLIPCEALCIVGLALIAFSQSLPTFLVAAVLMGMSAAGEQPILMAECVKSADAQNRGRASNTSYIGTDVGNFIGSNLAGVLVAALGYRNMYLASIIPVACCTIIFIMLSRRKTQAVSA